ncbi:hypothetical protein [Candidatus Poriferisocius sp.]|uniref:hypothetical protein n=1 Tax=Candidatus Poriferisocius sp. TaxID=3101276 RepID=UPI003B024AB0
MGRTGGSYSFGWWSVPEGRFTAISAGEVGHACGTREDGTVECWQGDNRLEAFLPPGFTLRSPRLDAPDGRFTAISAGHYHSCGIRENGTVACCGQDRFGETDAPQGRFTAISAGEGLSCGIREDRTVECWGWTTKLPNQPSFVTWV